MQLASKCQGNISVPFSVAVRPKIIRRITVQNIGCSAHPVNSPFQFVLFLAKASVQTGIERIPLHAGEGKVYFIIDRQSITLMSRNALNWIRNGTSCPVKRKPSF